MKYCCEKFERNMADYKDEQDEIEPHIVKKEDGYHVLGCCKSCYVLIDIEYCPFCGGKLKVVEKDK